MKPVPIDQFPTKKIGDLEYGRGHVYPFGASIVDLGINFSVFSSEAKAVTLLLYRIGDDQPFVEIPYPDEFRIGHVYSMLVHGLNFDEIEYGFRMDGEYAPEKGLYFDRNRPLLDPFARSISGHSDWGVRTDAGRMQPYRGRVIRQDYDWEGDRPLEVPLKDLIIYEMHVRSFTVDPSSGVRYPGTFMGVKEMIPYLKELGVNCVELLPIFEFDETENERTWQGEQLYNYWGYSTVGFFAPKAGYAVGSSFGMEADELKNLIKTLHKNGIGVILDVVFNHTAEGNEDGPVISYKGIDNRTWYLLTPEGQYCNYSGCGNTMNCNNPIVREVILECLRYWVGDYHVDGFRFDLASILSRDENGVPMSSPPVLETMAHDVILGNTILIAEAWDAGGLYQVGSFPSWNRWSEWNGKYRDCVRRFIKGDAGYAPELYCRINGSEDLYGERGAVASVNFITCHDGFTLRDLVSYNEKHNEANGEDNRDGCNDNDSWNCGVEGPCDDPEVNALRMRQIKNMLTILLMSRGVPMLLSGDEFGNSQQGNNNAYCHDNAISWLDWTNLKENASLHTYVKNLIALRRAHPVLRSTDYETQQNGTGYPELSFHSETPWELDQDSPSLVFACLFAEDHEKFGTARDCFIYLAVNAHWESHHFSLPQLPEGYIWHLAAESSCGRTYAPGEEERFEDLRDWRLDPRSTVVLIARKDDEEEEESWLFFR